MFRKLESFSKSQAGKWRLRVLVCHFCCTVFTPPHTHRATSRSGVSRNREESPVIGSMWGYWLALAMPDVDQFCFF